MSKQSLRDLGSSLDLKSLAQALRDRIRALNLIPFLNGALIEGINISTTTSFTHGLGRTPRGFIVVNRSTTASCHMTVWDENTITIVNETTAFRGSIWVW